jgi:uncharacterized protein YbaR (Trm112 family)
MPICPHCKNPIVQVDVEATTLTATPLNTWRGVSYACPTCNSVLSVGFDPAALEEDIVAAVVAALSNN